MCYKRYMRKWMRERLKRRKKPTETKPSEPAQAPLQPAYFDAHQAPAAEPEHDRAPEAADAAEPPVGEDTGEVASAASAPARRRRRKPKRQKTGRRVFWNLLDFGRPP